MNEQDKNTLNKGLSDIENLMSEYKEKALIVEPVDIPEPKKRGRKKKTEVEPETQANDPQQINAGEIISGALALLLIDMVLPRVMVLVNNKISKKKIKSKLLQLTPQQKNELEPIADAAMKQIMLKGNPVTVLIIALVGIYGMNLLMIHGE